jgi:tRNA pseudouridine38-40 synthase
VRLDLGYDGTDFSGWAAQPGRRTVEGELTAGMSRLLRGRQVVLTVAGRTDAGVHARGQVAHLDLDDDTWLALPGRSSAAPEQALVRRLAGVLPDDIVVHRARVAPADFDARFAALWRRYRYRIADSPDLADPLRRRDTVYHRAPLDHSTMHEAAQKLLGINDFAAFCKLRGGRTTVRTLLKLTWRRDPDGVLLADVVADAFCHSMVRFLVGACVAVGEGRRPVHWPGQVLASGLRDQAAQLMPAKGLSLEEVGYPPDDQLAARVAQTRAVRTLPG